MRLSATLVCLLTTLQANSETLNFAIYQLSGEMRTLIADGKLDYTLDDIDVTKWGNLDGRTTFKKSLKLKDGFRISVLVFQRNPEIGFGLSIKNNYHPDGFSWEWFELEKDGVYKKLQGEGYVRATHARSSDGIELQAVEFLTDITLRFQEDVKVEPGSKTHEIVVSQGSVFRFAL